MTAYKPSTAKEARARLAKRARRQRFWKENKKRISVVILLLILLVVLAFVTPWGPDYYRSSIEETKMEAPNRVRPGAVRELYNLATFYDYTMRDDNALDCFDEIALMYFGCKLTTYSADPEANFEVRLKAQAAIETGESHGPPFAVDASDLPYVGKAVFIAGQLMQNKMSKIIVARMYHDLYTEEFLKKHPEACEPEITAAIQGFTRRTINR